MTNSMDNSYDPMIMVVGYKHLFDQELSLEEIIEIISKYPSYFWLDIFAKIESLLVTSRPKNFNTQAYLAMTFFPPSTLSRIQRKAKGLEVYFSLGQINFLRKLAIAYGGSGDNVEIPPKVELSKVLLLSTDIQSEYDNTAIKKEEDKLESFAKFVARNGYLNTSIDFLALFARTDGMYIEQAKKLPLYDNVTFADFFIQHVGITVDEAIALSLALVTPLFQTAETVLGQTTIINPENYFDQAIIDPQKIKAIINSLTIDFSELKKDILKELENLDPSNYPVGYNLKVFRKTPLVRLENGYLVCVSLPCLIQKATQNAIWMLLDYVPKEQRQKTLNDLTDYRGRLFEEYIKEICKVFESQNKKISFCYIPPESNSTREEVGDSILIQDGKVVIFEAKSRQFNESFKATGDWNNDKLFIEELILKATGQIDIAAKKIKDGKISFPIDPKDIKKIYPVIVTYEPVPMHAKMQRFVRQKVQDASLLIDSIFAPLEIITVDDLERLRDATSTSTIVELLEAKDNGDPHSIETSFHNFFAKFISENEILSNGWNAEKGEQIWKQIRKTLKFRDEVFENK